MQKKRMGSRKKKKKTLSREFFFIFEINLRKTNC